MVLSRGVSILFLVFVLAACVASPTATIKAPGTHPISRHVFVNMASDPDLISLDVQTALEAEGLKIDLSSGESEMSQTVIGENTLTTHRRVSESQAPYELIVSYNRGGYPYRIIWRTMLRDRTTKKVIATYKYDFNAAYQSFGWSNEKILQDMISTLVTPFWAGNQGK